MTVFAPLQRSILPLDALPLSAMADFGPALTERVREGMRLSALFAVPRAEGFLLLALLSGEDALLLAGAAETDGSYPSLTPALPQAHAFEREMAETWGLRPEGHPWLKPLRFCPPRNLRGGKERPLAGEADFYRVEGAEIHEVAVGPIHAGVIEPGHFRFQCHGEEVLHLEISLGYQHRGVERALVGGPDRRTMAYMETLAGDSTIAHGTAYALVAEALSGQDPSPGARRLRSAALELERMANHVGDLGALAGDVGFLPTSAYCGRLRGDLLNLTALLCGNRFGRGLVRQGGVVPLLSSQRRETLLKRLRAIVADVESAVGLLWEAPSVLARFEGVGTLPAPTARDLGLVGPAARACAVSSDLRTRRPWDAFVEFPVPEALWTTGDVMGRARVRALEFSRSADFVERVLAEEIETAPPASSAPLKADHLGVSLVEGWRGEVCHAALTDERGRLAQYKVVDPSFHNWQGLAMAMRGQAISDFPVCNKSFGLSYCGHDL